MAPGFTPVSEPFAISRVAGRYLLFDVDVMMHARRAYNICGVHVGTVPNLSQQNVFLGIPLELQPEEARVLVEQGHAYIVDESEAHRKGFMQMSREERLSFLKAMDEQGMDISRKAVERAEERSGQALRNKGIESKETVVKETAGEGNELFDSKPTGPTATPVSVKKLEPTYVTPTTSYPPLTPSPPDTSFSLPDVPKSYPLFRYLHSRGYFTMPGIRFGCHYSVYPGDTLRFHSHYLATGMDWDEEFELLDVIGGGRLANRVKKAYLIGGEEKSEEQVDTGKGVGGGADVAPVRAFSIEWAGL
ncbi:SEN34 subunit of tRNA-splicing endonuclease [Periconia macrospinosa]|uniref:tRNA-splicing endonuclease subunit Sen34 n=1 Tax=Periconia macrospinosa TaxID=97972 RepID=A0A2V1DYS8_9PLEO|nr:SEN34 subunit of tRNA-splicing endonuclease [Periconia macrospinosa]